MMKIFQKFIRDNYVELDDIRVPRVIRAAKIRLITETLIMDFDS
jgi:hypothetical protein